jgi:hypothetical protein
MKPAAAIAADEQFVLSATYLEARGSETRSCCFTAGFMPRSAHRYRAHIDSTNEARHCTLAVFDVTRRSRATARRRRTGATHKKINPTSNSFVTYQTHPLDISNFRVSEQSIRIFLEKFSFFR